MASTASEPATEASKLLWSHLRIHRERGVAKVLEIAAVSSEAAFEILESSFAEPGEGIEVPWEQKHGGFMAVGQLATRGLLEHEMIRKMAEHATRLLDHAEPRIREEAGNALGSLSGVEGGPDVYEEIAKQTVLAGIGSNLTRDESDSAKEKKLLEKFAKAHNRDFFSSRPSNPAGLASDKIFHESAGWKTLETSSRALLAVAKAQGPGFAKHITEEVLGLVYHSLKHTNRFVRETAYYVCAEFCVALHQRDGEPAVAVADFDASMCAAIGKGLSDNWSQVRMAASVAGRRFILTLSEADRDKVFPTLLPRMVLNRYYVAEGVRLYSQETWKQVAGEQGKELVERFMKEVIDYYTFSADAANHAVREAACACIAELGLKVSGDGIRPYVLPLLRVLLTCFRDESWPVRDASCIASGRFLKCFPDEGKELLPEFLELFLAHVCDNIWSVRQNAAVSVAAMVEAYGDEVFTIVEPKLKELLPAAKEQSSQSTANAALENVTTFGVAPPKSMVAPMTPPTARSGVVEESADGGPRRIRYKFGDADPMHSNQQQFSCGSLAPKLRKGGCMDCDYIRPSEPWEKSDGCVYLLRELAPLRPDTIKAMLPQLAEIADLRDFKHHFHLLETIWKQLPTVAKGVGKRAFKSYIELFFPAIHYSLVSTNQLARAAAQDCVCTLGKLIGPGILRGRVEVFNPDYVDAFELAARPIPGMGVDFPGGPGGGMAGMMGGMPGGSPRPGAFPAGAFPGRGLDAQMPRTMPSFTPVPK